MTLLLAQAEPTTALQIPVSYGGIAGIVLGGVLVLALIAFWLLREFQAGRAALVEEVRLQMDAAAKPQSVEVQSPLTVAKHVTYVPRDEFVSEIKQAHGRMNRERDEARALIHAAEERMQAECKRIAADVANYNAQGEDRARRINERIDDLRDQVSSTPAATVRLLRETKGLL